ncbi:DNA-binding protein [Enterobacter sp. 10-1]|uniref:DNA-binding protein n=1 Tax=Raoultella scottii TaxID=3040937 RepID=A0ABU8Z1J7_9ENTR|nr:MULTISPECIES: DNA-binding protein StpA [Enterobacteriaceae]MVT02713.1 DNA-binding protein StpA [Raoultella sp. 10-1]PAC12124.1 DNA-binding protein [Enterobacter sp. 10-1]
MSLILRKLNNIRSLRVMTREFSIDVLDDMLEKLRTVTEEKRARQQAAREQKAEYQEKMSAWLELMMADGITPDELLGQQTSPGTKKARRPRPAKYRFIDFNGLEKTWTGQGRMPKPIARAISAGKTLESFLI